MNDILDCLAAQEKKEGKVVVLIEAIKKTDSQQMLRIIIIILKDLKPGINEKTIFNASHPNK